LSSRQRSNRAADAEKKLSTLCVVSEEVGIVLAPGGVARVGRAVPVADELASPTRAEVAKIYG
jgi:hypothetical protein